MGVFSDLPGDILLDILTRLPAESLLDCKLVSKTCRTVLQHPSLVQMHSDRLLLNNLDSTADSGKFSFIFQMEDLSEPYSNWLYYLEYDAEVSSHRLRKLNLIPPFKIYGLLGSSNGLVCINGLPNRYRDDFISADFVAFICNPITRECITLPELDRATYYRLVSDMFYGFGYAASTKEYKVVRVCTFWEKEKIPQVEVYTLGSGKGWRNAGKISIESSSWICKRNAVFVDGFLYWDFGNGKTVAFDLAGEVFVGCAEFQNGRLRIGVLGGYLCGTLFSDYGRSSDIWLLKKKEDESSSWSQEFSLINTDPDTEPLALTSSGAVLCHTKKLFLYDLKSSSSEMLEDFGKRIWHAVPHMNSLVSLKALGEDNTKTW